MDMTVKELKERMDRGETPTLIDVREPSEAAICRIPGAVLIPQRQLPQQLASFDKNQEIVVHCKSGGRSAHAVQFMTLQLDAGTQIPGYSKALGPVSLPSFEGRRAPAGFLFQRDTPAQWVRVVPLAMKVPEDRIIPTVVDASFPPNMIALFPDSTTIPGATEPGGVADSTSLTASLTSWEEGAMTVAISGSEDRTRYLLVAENWHPGWQATIDGQPATTHRANHAMLSVALPPGAREVKLTFVTPGYGAGKGITAISTVLALGIIGFGTLRGRKTDG